MNRIEESIERIIVGREFKKWIEANRNNNDERLVMLRRIKRRVIWTLTSMLLLFMVLNIMIFALNPEHQDFRNWLKNSSIYDLLLKIKVIDLYRQIGYKPLLSFTEFIKDINLALIGLLCSLIAAPIFEIIFLSREYYNKINDARRKSFSALFGLSDNQQTKVVFILPKFRTRKFDKKYLDYANDRIKETNGSYLGAIKNIEDSAIAYFAHSDVKAMSGVMSLFDFFQYNQNRPYIRTDLQAIINYYYWEQAKPDNSIPKELRLNNSVSQTQDLLKDIYKHNTSEQQEEYWKNLCKEINQLKERMDGAPYIHPYKTKIVIGLTSNLFLMELYNRKIYGTIKENGEIGLITNLFGFRVKLVNGKPAHFIDFKERKEIYRLIEVDESEHEFERPDYGLIAKFKEDDTTIIVLGGITEHSTRLMGKIFNKYWFEILEIMEEDIHKRMKILNNTPFVLFFNFNKYTEERIFGVKNQDNSKEVLKAIMKKVLPE